MTDHELKVAALAQAMFLSKDTDAILAAAEKIYQWLSGEKPEPPFNTTYPSVAAPDLETYRILTGKPK